MDKNDKDIEAKVEAFRARLEKKQTMPPPSQEDKARARADRLFAQLEKTEVLLDQSDHKRVRLLLRAAQLKADTGDFSSVYGLCAEVCGLARMRVLGVTEAHPILPSSRPPPRLPENGDDG